MMKLRGKIGSFFPTDKYFFGNFSPKGLFKIILNSIFMENSENQSVKNRLIEFIVFKNISIHKFEKDVGFSQGYIKNISKSIQPDKMEKIAKIYPELNLGWLMTGEGEMLRGQVQNVNGHHNTATMNGDITQNYAQSTDINLRLMDEITAHRKIIDKSQEQIDELIGIIKELAGKVRVES